MGSPSLESCHDSQHFLVVNLVIDFCGGEFSAVEGDGVEKSIF
jgi:hypothetical protein